MAASDAIIQAQVYVQINQNSLARLRQQVATLRQQIGRPVNVPIVAQMNHGQVTSAVGAISNALSQGQGKFAAIGKVGVEAMRSVNTYAKIANSTMAQLGLTMGNNLQMLLGFGLAGGALYKFVSSIREGVGAALDFQHSFVKLSQVWQKSVGQLGKVEDAITRVSRTMGVSSSEMADAALILAQAGFSIETATKAIETLGRTAVGPTFGTLKSTAEGLIAIYNQFGLTANDFEKAMGAVNAVSKSFAIESQDLITAVQKAGGVFASASKGVAEGTDALNQFIAVVTAVRSTTRESAHTIGAGLRTIFARMQRPKTIKFLKDLGISLTDLEGNFVGPYEAVERLSVGLRNLENRAPAFAAVIEEVGGIRQMAKLLPSIQEYEKRYKALNIARHGGLSLMQDEARAQESYLIRLTKIKEEFLAMMRDVLKTDTFKTMFRVFELGAKSLIKVAEALKHVLPLLAALGTMAVLRGAGNFMTGMKYSSFGRMLAGAKNSMSSPMVPNINRFPRGPEPVLRMDNFMGRASGGLIPGGKSPVDNRLEMLQPGSFVVSNKAVDRIGIGNLRRLQKSGQRGMPVMVASGEYVFNPHDTRRIGKNNLEMLNRGLAHRQDGGYFAEDFTSDYRMVRNMTYEELELAARDKTSGNLYRIARAERWRRRTQDTARYGARGNTGVLQALKKKIVSPRPRQRALNLEEQAELSAAGGRLGALAERVDENASRELLGTGMVHPVNTQGGIDPGLSSADKALIESQRYGDAIIRKAFSGLTQRELRAIAGAKTVDEARGILGRHGGDPSVITPKTWTAIQRQASAMAPLHYRPTRTKIDFGSGRPTSILLKNFDAAPLNSQYPYLQPEAASYFPRGSYPAGMSLFPTGKMGKGEKIVAGRRPVTGDISLYGGRDAGIPSMASVAGTAPLSAFRRKQKTTATPPIAPVAPPTVSTGDVLVPPMGDPSKAEIGRQVGRAFKRGDRAAARHNILRNMASSASDETLKRMRVSNPSRYESVMGYRYAEIGNTMGYGPRGRLKSFIGRNAPEHYWSGMFAPGQENVIGNTGVLSGPNLRRSASSASPIPIPFQPSRGVSPYEYGAGFSSRSRRQMVPLQMVSRNAIREWERRSEGASGQTPPAPPVIPPIVPPPPPPGGDMNQFRFSGRHYRSAWGIGVGSTDFTKNRPAYPGEFTNMVGSSGALYGPNDYITTPPVVPPVATGNQPPQQLLLTDQSADTTRRRLEMLGSGRLPQQPFISPASYTAAQRGKEGLIVPPVVPHQFRGPKPWDVGYPHPSPVTAGGSIKNWQRATISTEDPITGQMIPSPQRERYIRFADVNNFEGYSNRMVSGVPTDVVKQRKRRPASAMPYGPYQAGQPRVGGTIPANTNTLGFGGPVYYTEDGQALDKYGHPATRGGWDWSKGSRSIAYNEGNYGRGYVEQPIMVGDYSLGGKNYKQYTPPTRAQLFGRDVRNAFTRIPKAVGRGIAGGARGITRGLGAANTWMSKGAVGRSFGGFTGMFLGSMATTGGGYISEMAGEEGTKQSVGTAAAGGALGGAGIGLGVGAMFGPIGGAIGLGLGAVAGGIASWIKAINNNALVASQEELARRVSVLTTSLKGNVDATKIQERAQAALTQSLKTTTGITRGGFLGIGGKSNVELIAARTEAVRPQAEALIKQLSENILSGKLKPEDASNEALATIGQASEEAWKRIDDAVEKNVVRKGTSDYDAFVLRTFSEVGASMVSGVVSPEQHRKDLEKAQTEILRLTDQINKSFLDFNQALQNSTSAMVNTVDRNLALIGSAIDVIGNRSQLQADYVPLQMQAMMGNVGAYTPEAVNARAGLVQGYLGIQPGTDIAKAFEGVTRRSEIESVVRSTLQGAEGDLQRSQLANILTVAFDPMARTAQNVSELSAAAQQAIRDWSGSLNPAGATIQGLEPLIKEGDIINQDLLSKYIPQSLGFELPENVIAKIASTVGAQFGPENRQVGDLGGFISSGAFERVIDEAMEEMINSTRESEESVLKMVNAFNDWSKRAIQIQIDAERQRIKFAEDAAERTVSVEQFRAKAAGYELPMTAARANIGFTTGLTQRLGRNIGINDVNTALVSNLVRDIDGLSSVVDQLKSRMDAAVLSGQGDTAGVIKNQLAAQMVLLQNRYDALKSIAEYTSVLPSIEQEMEQMRKDRDDIRSTYRNMATMSPEQFIELGQGAKFARAGLAGYQLNSQQLGSALQSLDFVRDIQMGIASALPDRLREGFQTRVIGNVDAMSGQLISQSPRVQAMIEQQLGGMREYLAGQGIRGPQAEAILAGARQKIGSALTETPEKKFEAAVNQFSQASAAMTAAANAIQNFATSGSQSIQQLASSALNASNPEALKTTFGDISGTIDGLKTAIDAFPKTVDVNVSTMMDADQKQAMADLTAAIVRQTELLSKQQEEIEIGNQAKTWTRQALQSFGGPSTTYRQRTAARLDAATSGMAQTSVVGKVLNWLVKTSMAIDPSLTPSLNTGGFIPGSGPNRDTVPAMLTTGEFVVNRQAAQMNRQLLEDINGGKVRGYAAGGFVDPEDLLERNAGLVNNGVGAKAIAGATQLSMAPIHLNPTNVVQQAVTNDILSRDRFRRRPLAAAGTAVAPPMSGMPQDLMGAVLGNDPRTARFGQIAGQQGFAAATTAVHEELDAQYGQGSTQRGIDSGNARVHEWIRRGGLLGRDDMGWGASSRQGQQPNEIFGAPRTPAIPSLADRRTTRIQRATAWSGRQFGPEAYQDNGLLRPEYRRQLITQRSAQRAVERRARIRARGGTPMGPGGYDALIERYAAGQFPEGFGDMTVASRRQLVYGQTGMNAVQGLSSNITTGTQKTTGNTPESLFQPILAKWDAAVQAGRADIMEKLKGQIHYMLNQTIQRFTTDVAKHRAMPDFEQFVMDTTDRYVALTEPIMSRRIPLLPNQEAPVFHNIDFMPNPAALEEGLIDARWTGPPTQAPTYIPFSAWQAPTQAPAGYPSHAGFRTATGIASVVVGAVNSGIGMLRQWSQAGQNVVPSYDFNAPQLAHVPYGGTTGYYAESMSGSTTQQVTPEQMQQYHMALAQKRKNVAVTIPAQRRAASAAVIEASKKRQAERQQRTIDRRARISSSQQQLDRLHQYRQGYSFQGAKRGPLSWFSGGLAAKLGSWDSTIAKVQAGRDLDQAMDDLERLDAFVRDTNNSPSSRYEASQQASAIRQQWATRGYPLNHGGRVHYHTGGMVGGGNVPAVLQTGEMVLSRRDVQHLNTGGAVRGDNVNMGGDASFTQAVHNFSQSLPDFGQKLAQFTASLEQLADKMEKVIIPETITMQAEHNVNVNINGAEALSRIEDSLKDLIVNEVNKAINTLADPLTGQTRGGLSGFTKGGK